MANIGMKVRPVKEMEIFYGQDLVSGVKQTRTLPVVSTTPKTKIWSGEVIFSSNAVSADTTTSDTLPTAQFGVANEATWIKGTATSKYLTAGIPHFAVTDSDRFDVDASGKLLALVGTDTFQLGTCFYDHSVDYKDGDALYVKQDVITAAILPELFAAEGGITVNFLTTEAPASGNAVRVGYVVDGVIALKGNVAVDTGVYTLNGSNERVYTQAGMNPEGYQQTGNPLDRIVTGGPALWTEATDSKSMLKFTTDFAVETIA